MKVFIATLFISFVIMLNCDTATSTDIDIEPKDTTQTPKPDTTKPYNILTPKDGDIVYIGESFQIKMLSTGDIEQAGLELLWDNGAQSRTITPTNISGNTFNPKTTTLAEYTIPPYFTERRWDDSKDGYVFDTIVPVSDKCTIRMFKYNASEITMAESKGFFKIAKR